MKKIVCWGDLHGKNCWKDIVAQNSDANLYISIGDYLDTHENITGEEQLNNFQEILNFKKDNFDKVILLIGNHDCHYIENWNEHYSGFQSGMQWLFKDALYYALNVFTKPLLQMCYVQDKYLFSHAGVSKTWLKSIGYESKNLIDVQINETFKYSPRHFKFNGTNPYGDNVTQSPIWIREASLSKDKLEGFIQIVGHTTKSNLRQKGRWISNHDGFKVEDENIWMIDTLGTSKEYLVIENNEITIKNYE